jgi:hypothetical protein
VYYVCGYLKDIIEIFFGREYILISWRYKLHLASPKCNVLIVLRMHIKEKNKNYRKEKFSGIMASPIGTFLGRIQ